MDTPRELEPQQNPPDVRDLAHALTIFLSGRERLAVLRRLRKIDGDRRVALLTALGIVDGAWAAPASQRTV